MLTNCIVLHDAQNRRWLQFQNPIACLQANTLGEVIPLLGEVQLQVEQYNRYAAGFVSYEAAPACDPRLTVQPMGGFPLAWFGIYTQPQPCNEVGSCEPTSPQMGDFERLAWQPSLTKAQYAQAIQQIKACIAQGLTYQVNFSLRLQSPFIQDPWLYFLQLNRAQNGCYGAFVNLEEWAVCCASPELFFQWNDRTLISRPMKGTAPRGLTCTGDRQRAEMLFHSEKNRAENVMIVDMIRNDMGRIARTGSVAVEELFVVEQYPTLWQMTSPVRCSTDANFVEIMQALFPCASITGAPKPRTMQIIADLEDSPRRIYTGTIGFVAPNRNAQFNVAIRTVLVDKRKELAEYGVGGGIVWDSATTDEFEECCTKAKVLTQLQPDFSLLESLLWTPETHYFLLDLHLQRLQQSAIYFAFPLNLEQVKKQLQAIAQTFTGDRYKVRLEVSKSSEIHINAEAIAPSVTPVRVGIAAVPVNRSDVFLYHKTTHRVVYEHARKSCFDVEDVLLWNERRELTEFCNANVVVELDGQWYTPPVECGLLAGTFRAWLLNQQKIQERVILLEELKLCSRLFWINSVRHLREAHLSCPTGARLPVKKGGIST